MIETGQVLNTRTGRPTAPLPAIDLSTEKKWRATTIRLYVFLKKEALVEAKMQANFDHLHAILKNTGWLEDMVNHIDLKRLTTADLDTLNDLVFDQKNDGINKILWHWESPVR